MRIEKSAPEFEKAETIDYENYDYPLMEHVVGNSSFKEKFSEISQYMIHTDFFEFLCAKPKKSFLLVGPPGTGKTFSVKALRNELVQQGMIVKYFPYSIGTHGTAYINKGARILQNFFKMGKKMARNGYKVIYQFDEIDTIMGKRNQAHGHKEDDKLLECLMTNLQEINSCSNDEFFFGMTNFREALDEAAIRSGRIDEILEFQLPDFETRIEAYKKKVQGINEKHAKIFPKHGKDLIGRLNYSEISEKSQGFNYADLDQVVDNVLRKAAFDLLNCPKKIIKTKTLKVATKNFIQEVEKLKEARYKTRPNIGFK